MVSEGSHVKDCLLLALDADVHAHGGKGDFFFRKVEGGEQTSSFACSFEVTVTSVWGPSTCTKAYSIPVSPL